jgi:hypothetical protein
VSRKCPGARIGRTGRELRPTAPGRGAPTLPQPRQMVYESAGRPANRSRFVLSPAHALRLTPRPGVFMSCVDVTGEFGIIIHAILSSREIVSLHSILEGWGSKNHLT